MLPTRTNEYRNRYLKEISNSCLILIFAVCSVYTRPYKYCPENVNWNLAAHVICPSNYQKFHCLEIANGMYFWNCSDIKRIPAGEYPVLDSFSFNINSKQCPLNAFQPRPMFSNTDFHCVLEKSKCTEEGSITRSLGTTSEDVKCSCDYTRGYAFQTAPVNECYCIPSQEDCSCYLKKCNESYILNQDYQCSTNTPNLLQRSNKCTALTHYGETTKNVSTADDRIHYDDTYYNIQGKLSRKKHPVFGVLLFIAMFALSCSLFYPWYRFHRYHGAFNIRTTENEYSVDLASTVTLKVHVSRMGGIADFLFGYADIKLVTWNRDNTDIDVLNSQYKYKLTSKFQTDLQIMNVSSEDKGTYQCSVFNLAGDIYRSHLITLNVREPGNNYHDKADVYVEKKILNGTT